MGIREKLSVLHNESRPRFISFIYIYIDRYSNQTVGQSYHKGEAIKTSLLLLDPDFKIGLCYYVEGDKRKDLK